MAVHGRLVDVDRRQRLRIGGVSHRIADAGVPVHVLRKIAGHGSLTTTQRYLHPDATSIAAAGDSLTAFLNVRRSPNGPQLRAVPNPARSIDNLKKTR